MITSKLCYSDYIIFTPSMITHVISYRDYVTHICEFYYRDSIL